MAKTTTTTNSFKVHRSICLQLGKFTESVSQIVLAVESARPNCGIAVRALCSLHFTLDKANSIIHQCSHSSKLYLVIMAHKIVSRCEKIRSDLELYLTQIQQVVPILLDDEIYGIIHDLRAAEFSLELAEDEARKALQELLEKDLPGPESINDVEVDAVQIATLRLKITSPLALLEEKEALKSQIVKANDTDQREKELVKYFLYLLIKYRKFICQCQKSKKHENEDSVNLRVEDS